MPIRVTCPTCGRVGKAPEQAIGRTVRCPGCSQQYALTADLVQSDDQDEPAPLPKPKKEPTPPVPIPKPKGKVTLGEDIYALDETAVEPPKRPSRPMPPVPAPEEPDDDRPAGLTLSMPMLVGGALGVALVSILAAWGAMSLLQSGPAAPDNAAVAAASEPAPKKPDTPQPAPASPFKPVPVATPRPA